MSPYQEAYLEHCQEEEAFCKKHWTGYSRLVFSQKASS